MEFEKIVFEEWVKGIFDWPEGPEPWYYDLKNQGPSISPATSMAYLHRLFTESGEVLKWFSNRQLKDGFWYIADSGNSNEFCSLTDESLPLKEKLETIDSIFLLYKDCFCGRCSNYLSHSDESRKNPLNMVCYMWWDITGLPAWGGKLDNKEIDAACLGVMEKALSLENEACRESVLHGLGHAALYYPAQVKKIIDDFLAHNSNLRPRLLAYARAARTGMIQ